MSKFRVEHTRRFLEDLLMNAVAYSHWRLGQLDDWLEIKVYAGRYRRGPGKRPTKKEGARWLAMSKAGQIPRRPAFVGALEDAPADLSTNTKYMEGFGE